MPILHISTYSAPICTHSAYWKSVGHSRGLPPVPRPPILPISAYCILPILGPIYIYTIGPRLSGRPWALRTAPVSADGHLSYCIIRVSGWMFLCHCQLQARAQFISRKLVCRLVAHAFAQNVKGRRWDVIYIH